MDSAADMDRLGLLQRSWYVTRRVAGSVATNEQMQKEMQFGMRMRRGPLTDSNRDEIQDVYDEMIQNLTTQALEPAACCTDQLGDSRLW